MPYALTNNLGLESDQGGQDADTRRLFRLHQPCKRPSCICWIRERSPRPTICVNSVAPPLRYAVSCAEDSDDTIRNSTTEPPNQAWTEEGFHCRQQWLGGIPGVAGAIEIERWRGPAALDQAGPVQDNGSERAKEESAHGRGFISVPSFQQ